MITKTITILIVVGLVYLGLVQVIKFIRRQYLHIITFYNEMKVFFRSRKDGSRIIEIKIREPTMVRTVSESAPAAVIIPVAESVKQEAIAVVTTETVKEPTAKNAEEIVPDDMKEKNASQENERPEETLFILLYIEGKEYNSSDDVSAEELMVMNHTLFSNTATPQDEIATTKTICKIYNTTLFAEYNTVAGKEIKELFDKMTAKASKIEKSAGYDYSRHIKKEEQ